jgi:Phage integrase, N-terminal SAM-like domain
VYRGSILLALKERFCIMLIFNMFSGLNPFAASSNCLIPSSFNRISAPLMGIKSLMLALTIDCCGILRNTVFMNSYNRNGNHSRADAPALTSTRLLGQVRERLRYMHYSLQTEKSYVHWIKFFVRWHGRGGTMRHPREMGRAQVEAFLTMLATERKASASTHRQALSALLYLYKEVLGQELPWLQEIGRPVPTKRIPSVLTREEVQRILALIEPLREQLTRSRALWAADRAAERAGVALPHALEAKYPRAGQSWTWHWVFAQVFTSR